MDADPRAAASRASTERDFKGLVVKATRRGSLVVETENARRMMRRFAKLRPERDPARDASAASATP